MYQDKKEQNENPQKSPIFMGFFFALNHIIILIIFIPFPVGFIIGIQQKKT